jgi:hypothetical protein
MEIVLALIGLAMGVGLGAGGLLVYQRSQAAGKVHLAEEEAARILSEAQNQAKQTVMDAKDEALRAQHEAEENAKNVGSNSTGERPLAEAPRRR